MNLPEIAAIRSLAADQVEFDLILPSDLEAFAGHFPDQPVLPGVVQLDWVMRLATTHLALNQRVACDFQVKFRRVILPGEPVTLSLQLDRVLQTLVFEFRVRQDVASSGRVLLEGH